MGYLEKRMSGNTSADNGEQKNRRIKRMNTCTLTYTLSVGNQVHDRCDSINKNVEDRVPSYILRTSHVPLRLNFYARIQQNCFALFLSRHIVLYVCWSFVNKIPMFNYFLVWKISLKIHLQKKRSNICYT